MPVNEEGEDVNEDGTPITPEQTETSDWTQVVKLSENSKVTPYTIDELCTNQVPHNIPYFEVFRTDELYYEEYSSPYLSGSASSVDTSDDDTDSPDAKSSSSSSSSLEEVGVTHNTKMKNTKLKSEIESIVKSHFKKGANHKTLVDRYMSCKTNKKAIWAVTNRSKKWLKGNAHSHLNDSIYNCKRKYS